MRSFPVGVMPCLRYSPGMQVIYLGLGGLGLAIVGVALAYLGQRFIGDGAMQLAPLLPLLGAMLLGLLYPETQGWPRRLLASGLGFVVALVLGGALVWVLMRNTDWFSIGDTHGHWIMAVLLLLLVGIAGSLAATPAHFARGLTLSLSFFWGLLLVIVIVLLVTGDRDRLSTIHPWAIVTLIGTLVGGGAGHLLGMK